MVNVLIYRYSLINKVQSTYSIILFYQSNSDSWKKTLLQ